MKKSTVLVITIFIIGLVSTFALFLFCSRSSNEITLESIQQEPELPQGCEITSLAMVINYYGFDVDKVELADIYLPKATDYHNADPNSYYIGDPHGNGWYCFSKPIVAAANHYLSTQETILKAYDVTGITSKDISQCIDDGVPVILWSTLNLEDPKFSTNTVWSYNNIEFQPFINLHAVVVYGYTARDFMIIDPQGGYARFGKKQLMDSNSSIGSYAVVIR